MHLRAVTFKTLSVMADNYDFVKKSKNHRMFGLGRDFRDHLAVGRDNFQQVTLIKISKLTLNTSNNWASTASQGKVLQRLFTIIFSLHAIQVYHIIVQKCFSSPINSTAPGISFIKQYWKPVLLIFFFLFSFTTFRNSTLKYA